MYGLPDTCPEMSGNPYNKFCFSGQSLHKIKKLNLHLVCRERFKFEISPKA